MWTLMNLPTLRKKGNLLKKVSDSLRNKFHKTNHPLSPGHLLFGKRINVDRQVHREKTIVNRMISWAAVARRAMELKKRRKNMMRKWTHLARMSRWTRNFRRNLNVSRRISETIVLKDNSLNQTLFMIKIVV